MRVSFDKWKVRKGLVEELTALGNFEIRCLVIEAMGTRQAEYRRVGTPYVQVSLFEGDKDSLKFGEDATVILVWTEMGMHVVIEESVPA